MSATTATSELHDRIRHLSEELGRALQLPIPAWLAESVRGCIIELDLMATTDPRESQMAGLFARAQSLLAICRG